MKLLPVGLLLSLIAMSLLNGCEPGKENSQSQESDQTNKPASRFKFVQTGVLREAIGEQKHQGRVRLGELLEQPHFFGVGALEGLKGEIGIIDGELTVSTVNSEGKLTPVVEKADQLQATVLFGAYVTNWKELTLEQEVPAEKFDDFLATSAESFGLDPDKPFLFTIEGEFTDLHLHVINGACPVHARMQNSELPKEQLPLEINKPELRGTLVGVYARDAVGKITQPATETHRHLVFTDSDKQKQVGHVEKGGVSKGAKVRIAQ